MVKNYERIRAVETTKQPTPQQIEEWKKEHGELIDVYVSETGKSYILRKPTRQEYKRFIDTVQRSTSEASMTLVLDCLVAPDRKSFTDDCAENMSLHLTLLGELQEKFGGNLTATSKKL